MQKEGNIFEHHSQIVTAISTNPPKFHQWVAQVKLTSALLVNHLFHFSVVSDDKDLIGSSCYNLLQVCYALLVSIIYMKWKNKAFGSFDCDGFDVSNIIFSFIAFIFVVDTTNLFN